LESVQVEFNKVHHKDDKKVSMADLIVLGGCTAIEEAFKNAGNDAQEQTKGQQFSYLEPKAVMKCFGGLRETAPNATLSLAFRTSSIGLTLSLSCCCCCCCCCCTTWFDSFFCDESNNEFWNASLADSSDNHM
jgi:hypothetical protein